MRKNSPSVELVNDVYSMSHGIIARILLVSVCVAYGPVAAEKEAVSINIRVWKGASDTDVAVGAALHRVQPCHGKFGGRADCAGV